MALAAYKHSLPRVARSAFAQAAAMNRRTFFTKLAVAVFAAAVLLTAASKSFASATIVILNNDSAGVGFNDTTPVAPVGNNNGTTLGKLNQFGGNYIAAEMV